MQSLKSVLEPFRDISKMIPLTRQVSPLPASSFVIVTYNRCPHKEHNLNPLVWAVQTLNSDQYYLPREIVIIDDCSTDNTPECVDWLKANTAVPIVYYRNAVHKELSFCRALGLKLAGNELVFMGDDDCLYNELFLTGSMMTYQLLAEQYREIAIVNLNAFERCNQHSAILPAALIGKTAYEHGTFCQNFHAFPEEYLSCPEWLHTGAGLLKPLQCGIFRGVNLCNAKLVMDAGNYSDLSMWKFGYSEHLELSKKLADKGYKIFHQPDPKIYAIHLRYGRKSGHTANDDTLDEMVKGTEYKLGELIEMSDVPSLDSGTRSSPEDFHLTEIGTLFSFYLKFSEELGSSFALKEFERFVLNGQLASSGPATIDSLQMRMDIWSRAVNAGIEATSIQTGSSYPGLAQLLVEKARQRILSQNHYFHT